MFGITHPLMGEMVQAAVTIRPDTTDDQTEIITYCRRRLSRYKVPSIVFVVKELPTSANGKVMKQSLREQCQDVATPSRRNSTPSTISNAFSSPMKGSTSKEWGNVLAILGLVTHHALWRALIGAQYPRDVFHHAFAT